MKLTYLSFTTILFLMSGIDEIFAQFKVIKMEELRPMTSTSDDAPSTVHGHKPKLARNSNVTLIHIMKGSPMKRRRSDKEIRPRAEASDLEIVTVTPVSDEEARNNNFLKLHILNVRTGKIQDAIISTTEEREFFDDDAKSSRQKAAPVSRKKINAGKREIIRIKPHNTHHHPHPHPQQQQQQPHKPETTFNEINPNNGKKPYKMKNKFKSSKCKCEDNSKMWNCRQIQTQIGRCHSNQFLCCSNYNQFDM